MHQFLPEFSFCVGAGRCPAVPRGQCSSARRRAGARLHRAVMVPSGAKPPKAGGTERRRTYLCQRGRGRERNLRRSPASGTPASTVNLATRTAGAPFPAASVLRAVRLGPHFPLGAATERPHPLVLCVLRPAVYAHVLRGDAWNPTRTHRIRPATKARTHALHARHRPATQSPRKRKDKRINKNQRGTQGGAAPSFWASHTSFP